MTWRSIRRALCWCGMASISALRLLVQMDFPKATVRFWDGSGPYVDAAGDLWRGAVITQGLDALESAINSEAVTLTLGLSGVDAAAMQLAFDDLLAGEVVGAKVILYLQPCDGNDQPEGPAEVRFSGTIDNMPSEEAAEQDGTTRRIVAEIVNRFTLRRLVSGAVLSDTDQKARAFVLNPTSLPDRFCERVSGLADKSIWWPRFT